MINISFFYINCTTNFTEHIIDQEQVQIQKLQEKNIEKNRQKVFDNKNQLIQLLFKQSDVLRNQLKEYANVISFVSIQYSNLQQEKEKQNQLLQVSQKKIRKKEKQNQLLQVSQKKIRKKEKKLREKEKELQQTVKKLNKQQREFQQDRTQTAKILVNEKIRLAILAKQLTEKQNQQLEQSINLK